MQTGILCAPAGWCFQNTVKENACKCGGFHSACSGIILDLQTNKKVDEFSEPVSEDHSWFAQAQGLETCLNTILNKILTFKFEKKIIYVILNDKTFAKRIVEKIKEFKDLEKMKKLVKLRGLVRKIEDHKKLIFVWIPKSKKLLSYAALLLAKKEAEKQISNNPHCSLNPNNLQPTLLSNTSHGTQEMLYHHQSAMNYGLYQAYTSANLDDNYYNQQYYPTEQRETGFYYNYYPDSSAYQHEQRYPY